MALQYAQGDLFFATNCFLLHACNCRRNWGSGVAAQFARLFPGAYRQHQIIPANKPGEFQFLPTPEGVDGIICLFTSDGYGRHVDSPATIVKNTEKALNVLEGFFALREIGTIKIASPKINAGLFNVPWEQTAGLIEDFLIRNPKVEWTIYTLD